MATVTTGSGSKLRDFSATHIDKEFDSISDVHENELFFNCTLRKLNGATLKNCDMNHSKVPIENIRDILGLTITLDCNTFANVELSPLVLDLMLCLLLKTKGNNAKRKQILDVIGKDRLKELLYEMSHLEG